MKLAPSLTIPRRPSLAFRAKSFVSVPLVSKSPLLSFSTVQIFQVIDSRSDESNIKEVQVVPLFVSSGQADHGHFGA